MRGGDQRMRRGVHVGHHGRSGAAVFLTLGGVERYSRIARMMKQVRWDHKFRATSAASQVNRRRNVAKRDLAMCGYIDECLACTQADNAKVLAVSALVSSWRVITMQDIISSWSRRWRRDGLQ